MGALMKIYLVLGAATLLACAIMAAQLVIIAPAHGYQILVMTNSFGEGLFEAALLLIMLPSWVLLFRRLVAAV